MDAKRFDELQLTGKLPSPSGVGLSVLELTQQDDVTIDQVVAVIQSDPTLTGRLLQLANSAANAGVKPAVTAKEAALRLGLRAVCSVSLSFSVLAANRRGMCERFDYDEFWAESIRCAAAAQVLAGRTRGVAPAEAFTCALLAGIGKLALASIHQEAYCDVLRRMEGREGAGLAALERETFGLDHRELAIAMLRGWRLPQHLIEAVSGAPTRAAQLAALAPGTRRFAAVLTGALAMGAAQSVTPGSDPERCRARLAALEEAAQVLELDDAAVEEVWAETAGAARSWGRFVQLDAAPCIDLAALRAGAEGSAPKSDSPAPALPAGASRAPAAGPKPAPPACPLPGRPQVGAAGDSKTLDPASEDPSPTRGLAVLVVEDDPVSRRLLCAQLKKEGCLVVAAEDGHQGLEMALEHCPSVVVTDWMMPRMDGIAMVRALRRSEFGRKLHVILLTGRDEDDRVVEAFENGVDEYLTKPLNPRILIARVRSAARSVELRRQVAALLEEREKQLAQQLVLSRKLELTSYTDELTGLPNRRRAMQRLEEVRTAAEAQPFSVLLLDIDRFKSVNDTYGHDAGDMVLVETAKALRQGLRQQDLVCRLGGEEFLVICPDTRLPRAAELAERMRAAVEANRIDSPMFQGNVTISLGVAEWSESTPTLAALLKRADERVYRAKHAGRNRVVADDAAHPMDRAA